MVEKEEEINTLERNLRKITNEHNESQEKISNLEKIIETQKKELENSREEIRSLHDKSVSKSELKTLTTVIQDKKIHDIDESHISPCNNTKFVL